MWEIDVVANAKAGEIIATLCTICACCLSIYQIFKHMRNYTQPILQRRIVRIILMVPIYAVDSLLSLLLSYGSLYLDLIRDCYEAYVLYNFFFLLIAYINESSDGGDVEIDVAVDLHGQAPSVDSSQSQSEQRVQQILQSKELQSHPFPLCHLPQFSTGGSFLNWSKRGILQFVLVKPAMAALAIVLDIYGYYGDGDFSPLKGYLYITSVNNVSVTVAMYYLVLFYRATEIELRPHNPVPKFVCIKAVIFLTFWQGVVIALLAYLGVVHGDLARGFSNDDVTNGLQDFLICIEMLLLAAAHIWTFSHKPFKDISLESSIPCYSCLCCCCCCYSVTKNFGHVISQNDLIEESVDAFGINEVPRKLAEVPQSLSEVPHRIGQYVRTAGGDEENLGS